MIALHAALPTAVAARRERMSGMSSGLKYTRGCTPSGGGGENRPGEIFGGIGTADDCASHAMQTMWMHVYINATAELCGCLLKGSVAPLLPKGGKPGLGTRRCVVGRAVMVLV